MPGPESKAVLYRHKANGLRALAEIMERSTSRIELLAEAARWERLARAVEDAEQRNLPKTAEDAAQRNKDKSE
jgi:hypothetical protein